MTLRAYVLNLPLPDPLGGICTRSGVLDLDRMLRYLVYRVRAASYAPIIARAVIRHILAKLAASACLGTDSCEDDPEISSPTS